MLQLESLDVNVTFLVVPILSKHKSKMKKWGEFDGASGESSPCSKLTVFYDPALQSTHLLASSAFRSCTRLDVLLLFSDRHCPVGVRPSSTGVSATLQQKCQEHARPWHGNKWTRDARSTIWSVPECRTEHVNRGWSSQRRMVDQNHPFQRTKRMLALSKVKERSVGRVVL